jgi:hypothetical protein
MDYTLWSVPVQNELMKLLIIFKYSIAPLGRGISPSQDKANLHKKIKHRHVSMLYVKFELMITAFGWSKSN